MGSQRVGHDWATCSFNFTFILLKYFKGKRCHLPCILRRKFPSLLDSNLVLLALSSLARFALCNFSQWMPPLCLNCCKQSTVFTSVDAASHVKKDYFVFLLRVILLHHVRITLFSRSDTTEQLHFHVSLSCIGEGMATHSGVLAWRIPGTGHPGRLPSLGSHRVGHAWSDSATAEHSLGISSVGPGSWSLRMQGPLISWREPELEKGPEFPNEGSFGRRWGRTLMQF